MYKNIVLPSLTAIAICILPITLIAAESNNKASGLSIEYVNGYTLGQYLIKHYEGQKKEAFLQGLQNAVDGAKLKNDLSSALTKVKAGYLSDTTLQEDTKAAYAYGYLTALEPKLKGYTFDYLTYLQGMIDLENQSTIDYVTTNKAQIIAQGFNKKKIAQHAQELVKINNENAEKGKLFLAANALKKDIIQLDTGLQYKIIKKGTGSQPTPVDKVAIQVMGKKINGDIFYDSKKESNNPLTINISGSIPAWRQALTKMSQGAIWELYVPANLAYANLGWKDVIQPGEVLIYQIELVSIYNATNKSVLKPASNL